jgi:F420-dependent oxidoreductase-like protein
MRLGLHYWNFAEPAGAGLIAPTLARTAQIAEQAGLWSFTLMDHFLQTGSRGSAADEPMLEGFTALGYVAAVTQHITLGQLVSGVVYRHPGLLAKIVTTLDVVSGGRAVFGIGASWYEREQRALGVPVVSVAERFERLEETLQICLQMWSDNNGPYQGRHYQLAETLCVPAPIRRPHPQIIVGGGGEKKTLLLVARYADACNLYATSVEDVARKLDVLRAHCDDEGRDYDGVEKTVMASRCAVLQETDAFLADAEEYAKLGVSEIQLLPDRHPVVFTEQVAERIAPAIAAIG